MKKTLSLIVILMICLSLCACSDTDAIDKALQGEWISENTHGGIFRFNNGRFSCEAVGPGLSLGVKEGSYKISNDAIELSYDNGVKSELAFTYENGILSIDGLFEQKRIDEALQGKWIADFDHGSYTCFTFDNGRFSTEEVVIGINLGVKEGNYDISAGIIYLEYDDKTLTLDYEYKNGSLTIDGFEKE